MKYISMMHSLKTTFLYHLKMSQSVRTLCAQLTARFSHSELTGPIRRGPEWANVSRDCQVMLVTEAQLFL